MTLRYPNNCDYFQVEAALIAEPNNEELLKLKEDLDEIIRLQEELVNADAAGGTSANGDSSSKSRKEKVQWKVRRQYSC